MSTKSHSSSTFKFLHRFIKKAKQGLGTCFSINPSSRTTTAGSPPTTKVIKLDGSLTEYNLPIRVSHVLLMTQCLSSVLCDSDELCYGSHVRALDSHHLLRPGNIYFVLPKKSLNYPLTAADMAALAGRANTAFAKAAAASIECKKKKTCGIWKGVRIVPNVVVVTAEVSDDCYERINEGCVEAVVPVMAEDSEKLGAAKLEEEFEEEEKLSEEEFERFMTEMEERNKKQMKQSFYTKKRFVPTLTTIPEE